MDNLYLIAHKVRGEPAFDIAERSPCPVCQPVDGDGGDPDHCSSCDGDGYWWIIPTSGHRAYPYFYTQTLDMYPGLTIMEMMKCLIDPPLDLRDHYEASAAPAGKGIVTDLFAKLGFKRAGPIVTRRI